MRKIFLKHGRYTSHSWPTLGHMPVSGPAIIFGKCYVEIKFHLSGFQEMGWMPGQHWASARKDKEERCIKVKKPKFLLSENRSTLPDLEKACVWSPIHSDSLGICLPISLPLALTL